MENLASAFLCLTPIKNAVKFCKILEETRPVSNAIEAFHNVCDNFISMNFCPVSQLFFEMYMSIYVDTNLEFNSCAIVCRHTRIKLF